MGHPSPRAGCESSAGEDRRPHLLRLRHSGRCWPGRPRTRTGATMRARSPCCARPRIDQISVECAASGVDPSVLALARGKDLMVGVIDVGTEEVETPQTVAGRIRTALEYVEPDHLFPCTDCGMVPRSRAAARGKMQSARRGRAHRAGRDRPVERGPLTRRRAQTSQRRRRLGGSASSDRLAGSFPRSRQVIPLARPEALEERANGGLVGADGIGSTRSSARRGPRRTPRRRGSATGLERSRAGSRAARRSRDRRAGSCPRRSS